MNRHTLGGLAAILLWSTTVGVSRSLAEQLGPSTAAGAVLGLGGTGALVTLLSRRSRRRQVLDLPRAYLLGCGFLFCAYMAALYLAVGLAADRQQTLEVGLLNYLWPVLTVLFSLLLIGNRARWTLAPGALLALFGVVLVLRQDGELSWSSFTAHAVANPVAYTLGVAAAVTWALYSNLTRRWAGQRTGGAVGLFLPASALVLLLVGQVKPESPAWSLHAGLETVFLGLATWAGYELWDGAMRRGHVVAVASASYLTPLLSTLFSCLYLAVRPGSELWAGCLLLVTGSVLSWRSVRPTEAR